MKQTALQEYAEKKLKSDIDRMLKDPRAIAPPAELKSYWIPFFRKVAIQCGLNFNRLLTVGSPFEQERMRRIEAGEPHDAKSIGAFSNERETFLRASPDPGRLPNK